MAHSMTGYGREEQVLNGRNIIFEIKGVNSRYFEYSSRLPRNLGFVDDELKKLISSSVFRGKVDIYLNVTVLEGSDYAVHPNVALAADYHKALSTIAAELGIENDVKATDMTRFGDIFVTQPHEEDLGELQKDILAVAQVALEKFVAMRKAEGQKMQSDMQSRLETLRTMVVFVEKDNDKRVSDYTERLHERLQEVLQDTTIDDSRMLTEAAIFADKTAVDEETVRLNSHLAQFEDILNAEGAVGRKLDFLTQEINREVNTIGSKCQDIEITQTVVEMKAEIEKIREQIQNIE